MNLYKAKGFSRGRPLWIEALWLLMQAIFVSSRIPGSALRRFLLKLFGADIGRGVIIKPGLRVKFPWKLTIGDYSWIGEDVWIDNLAHVEIGSHCCISQAAYLCTGSHDWSKPAFDLLIKPIKINNGAWIAAKAVVGPGVIVGEGAVLSLGSIASKNLDPWGIYQGNPAKYIRKRVISATST